MVILWVAHAMCGVNSVFTHRRDFLSSIFVFLYGIVDVVYYSGHLIFSIYKLFCMDVFSWL